MALPAMIARGPEIGQTKAGLRIGEDRSPFSGFFVGAPLCASVPERTVAAMRRHRTQRFLFATTRAAGVAAAVLATAWAALALWHRLPFPASVRGFAAAACIGLGLAAVLSLFGPIGRGASIAFALALAATAVWWSTIRRRTMRIGHQMSRVR